MGHDLQHNHWRAEAGKPLWTKAEDPNKSWGKTETYWQAPSPKRHLQHPVCISTLGKCPRISSYSSCPLGMKSATKWISRDLRIDSAYCYFAIGSVPPSTYSLGHQSNKKLTLALCWLYAGRALCLLSVLLTLPLQSYCNLVRRVRLFWRWCHWSTERLSNLPKVAYFLAKLGL